MTPFKKILCPLDFSEASSHAFDYARTFASVFHAELILLHVSPNITDAYVALLPDFPNHPVPGEEDVAARFAEFVGDRPDTARKVIKAGTPYIQILDFATEEAVDLIIMGAKGHSKFERLLLGTTGEKVARNSCKPVLTVHPKPDGLPIKKILVPIDFSELSYAVLPTVAAIADKFQAEISLLHVVETGQAAQGRKSQAEAHEYFERIRDRLSQQWELPAEFTRLQTRKFIRHNSSSAGYGIVEFAQDWDVDLLVMATHGRTGLDKVLLGSVTEKVIRIAPYPVLSLRSNAGGNST